MENELIIQLSKCDKCNDAYTPQIIDISLRELSEYSQKGFTIIALLEQYICDHDEDRGKALIVVNHIYEVLNFIGSLLKSNGIIQKNDTIMPNSRCCVRQTHEGDHLSSPTRFVSIHTHTGEELGIENIFKEYNNTENNFGKNIKVMIGGKILVLEHNLMGTELFIGFPQPVSLSIQSISRTIRPNALKSNKTKSLICINLVIALQRDAGINDTPPVKAE